MTDGDFPLELGPDAPIVRFSGVTKRYGDLTVLDSLDLDVAANEIVSIIGPSGSGKTTVLRMLMTLEEINEGVIYVDGQPLTHMPRNGGLVWADNAHLRKMRLAWLQVLPARAQGRTIRDERPFRQPRIVFQRVQQLQPRRIRVAQIHQRQRPT